MNRFESLQDSYMLHDDICNADWEMVRLFLDKAIENIGEIEEKNQKFTLFSSSNVLGKLKRKKNPQKQTIIIAHCKSTFIIKRANLIKLNLFSSFPKFIDFANDSVM